jgi:hypothetical protein
VLALLHVELNFPASFSCAETYNKLKTSESDDANQERRDGNATKGRRCEILGKYPVKLLIPLVLFSASIQAEEIQVPPSCSGPVCLTMLVWKRALPHTRYRGLLRPNHQSNPFSWKLLLEQVFDTEPA